MAAPHQHPLHLLRALLREASYLPDATARAYFRRYIVARFKAYQPRQNATASAAIDALHRGRQQTFKRRHAAIIQSRTQPLLRKGRKGLNFLRRANQGEIPCLEKVLFFAYGRLGRRKYALLADLLQPDRIMDGGAMPSPDSNASAPLQKLYFSNKRFLQYFDAPKVASKTHYSISISDRFSRLRAVLKSQHQKGISIHRELKGPVMKTPINNVWERPMPIRRARNNVGRWYAETMTRLLPPLPNHEWDKVYAMMVGDRPIDLTKPRARGLVQSPDLAVADELFTSTVDEAIALDKPSRADKPAGIQRPHTITPKFMRRLYTRILTLCCKLDYNEETKRWIATWGAHNKTIKPKIYSAPTDPDLFAGVDKAGHIPKTPKKHDVNKSPHLSPRNADGEYVRFPFFAEFLPESSPLRKELDEWKRKRAAAAATQT
ncbi:gcn5-related n-acetyltransferase [Curvularia clavata]|uniref:Gcn5-related n-acetyltransferase n=1 Tax=Curvularia clavata TaxID=95742 RepID=A0A9Q8Z5S9_CURCL|nr:gcn5-related n-acetyltransferase [Curvularia clavata]